MGVTTVASRRAAACPQGNSCRGRLKTKLVHHRRFTTGEQATCEIREYIAFFYNRIRKQARPGDLSPAAFSQQYHARQMAAQLTGLDDLPSTSLFRQLFSMHSIIAVPASKRVPPLFDGSAKGRERPVPGVMALAMVVSSSLLGCGQPERVAAVPTAVLESLQQRLDKTLPGFGLTDYPSDTPDHIPKGYAMVLLGEIDRGRVIGAGGVPDPGPAAGFWLLDHADQNGDGVIGWGVPVAWDAYGDGSVNPANTEYTIATAIVIHALLDWMEASPQAPRQRIVDVVGNALLPYLDPLMRTPAGLLPYSLRDSDRPYDTFNPAAYLAGQMQRFSRMTPDAKMSSKLRAAADATMQVLLDQRQITPDGAGWYWNYSIQESVANDLPHASYIVDGIITYMAYAGRLSDSFERAKVSAHLMDFPDSATGAVRAWPRFRPDVTVPARLYDLGIAMHVACAEPALTSMRGILFAQLPAYRDADGHYRKYPMATDQRNLVVTEYENYLFRGLASCAAKAPRQR